MNKEQAQEKYLNLLQKLVEDEERLIKEAQEEGLWERGLDANRELFKELHIEFGKKIQEIKDQLSE